MENHHVYIMGKSTISMAIFNCYVSSPEGTHSGITMNHYESLGSTFQRGTPWTPHPAHGIRKRSEPWAARGVCEPVHFAENSMDIGYIGTDHHRSSQIYIHTNIHTNIYTNI